MRLATGRYAAPLAIISCALMGGACSQSAMPGPSWNLTGPGELRRRPPEPIYAEPPRPAVLPPQSYSQPPVATYRGGRDPLTGRAPSYNGAPAVQHAHPHASSPGPLAPSVVEQRMPPAPTSGGRARSVEVRPGQTLSMIASEQRVSIASLMAANNLRDPYLIPGQVLVIPGR